MPPSCDEATERAAGERTDHAPNGHEGRAGANTHGDAHDVLRAPRSRRTSARRLGQGLLD